MSVGAKRRTLDELLDEATAGIQRLEPQAAFEASEHGALIVDIRSALDRERDGIVPGSLHIPRAVLEWRLDPDSPSRNPHIRGLEQQILQPGEKVREQRAGRCGLDRINRWQIRNRSLSVLTVASRSTLTPAASSTPCRSE
jgi:hypothetical protein